MKKLAEISKCPVIHQELIKETIEKMPAEKTLNKLIDIFKIFGDATRIKILYSLFQHEMCVCDLTTIVGVSQSATSHQLRILKEFKLVKYRKEGKAIYYSLADEHIKSIFYAGLEHAEEE